MVYRAHSPNRGGQSECLAEHLRRVSETAGIFAQPWGDQHRAQVAALLHDLGKYADQFQRRLIDPREAGRDHWSAGAAILLTCYRRAGLLPAVVAAGHHAGLDVLEADWKAWRDSLCRYEPGPPPLARMTIPHPVTETDLTLLKHRFDQDGLRLPPIVDLPSMTDKCADDMLDARMLFSALVDADFIETEAHFAGTPDCPRKYRPDGPGLAPARALETVLAETSRLAAASDAPPDVQEMRESLLSACLRAAELPTGLFTLSAPTGSGKTLAMLAFALRHAMAHDLRRVILVMPFLSIIDQAAGIYRRLFDPQCGWPDNYVLEDHSLADAALHSGHSAQAGSPRLDDDGQNESRRIRRLLAENWDSPIILTTNVQCLESLMSNRSGACRKLHRMARSVIMFDEAQTLPKKLAVPTLATLSRLSDRYGSTIVFATATQPAFDHLDAQVRGRSATGWQPTEIVPPAETASMFRIASRRTHVSWEHDVSTPLEDVANAIANHIANQVLCIVNLKRHATRIFELLDAAQVPGLYHLSTSMCPAHRESVLAEVMAKLKDPSGPPLRLIATQCVEAGVDLDFPVVYRALAPLDAIAQAAGRCNRHGRRPQRGTVHVFLPDDGGKITYPPGYGEPVGVTSTFLNHLRQGGFLDDTDIIQNPQRLRAYYTTLYSLTGTSPGDDMEKALDACSFVKVADAYRLIDKRDNINVLVPYDVPTFEALKEQIAQRDRPPGFIREWIRRARKHSVSQYRDKPGQCYLEPIQFGRQTGDSESETDWWMCLPTAEYHPKLGLRLPEEAPMFG